MASRIFIKQFIVLFLNYNKIFASYRFHPRITSARNDIEGKNF